MQDIKYEKSIQEDTEHLLLFLSMISPSNLGVIQTKLV